MVARALDQARSLTQQLCPPTLYELGLEKAVAELAENTRKLHEIALEFRDDLQPKPMDTNLKVFLFRVIQELLRNVATHSRARRASVEMTREGRAIRVTVADDGVGFDPAVRMGSGIGLFSIRERLQAIGGTLDVDSSEGKGTRISLSVPLGGE
jgi:signal transduction histidine kinase